jgi:hypothetical protein
MFAKPAKSSASPLQERMMAPPPPDKIQHAHEARINKLELRVGTHMVEGVPEDLGFIWRNGRFILAFDENGRGLSDHKAASRLAGVSGPTGKSGGEIAEILVSFASEVSPRAGIGHYELHRELEVLLQRNRIVGIIDNFCVEKPGGGIQEKQFLLSDLSDLIALDRGPSRHLLKAWQGACIARGWPRGAVETTPDKHSRWQLLGVCLAPIEHAPPGADAETWKNYLKRTLRQLPGE